LPFLSGQHRLGGNRRPVRNMVFAALSGSCDGEDQGDVSWVSVPCTFLESLSSIYSEVP
jgi:hypothetical protein